MIAEIFLRYREEKGYREGYAEGFKQGLAEGRLEARRHLAARLEPMTTEQRLAEIDRLIQQARKTGAE